MHTSFSGDSTESPKTMILAAKAKGLSGITITDHLDLDYAKAPGLFDLDIPRYFKEMSALSDEYSDEDFGVLIGLELGLQPHLSDRHSAIIKEYPFDFVIGSVHVVGGIDPYYDEYFAAKDVKSALVEYLDCVIENIKAFSDFDSLGHLDYVVRYAAKRFGYDSSVIDPADADYRKRLEVILGFIIDNDIALEVNTGSFRSGMTVPNPSYEILKLYRALGGESITIGADAHKKDDIAKAYDIVLDALKTLGFTEYCVYKDRTVEKYML